MTEFVPGDGCPVYANCANAEAQCLACYFPEDALGPTQYLPRDKKIEHPLTIERKAARAARKKDAKRSEGSKRGKQANRRGHDFERRLAKATGGRVQIGSGAYRGNLSNDVVLGAALAGLQVEAKYGVSYPAATLYRFLSKGDWVFVQGHSCTFVLSTLKVWELRKWEGLTAICVASKQVTEWEGYLLDDVEKPEAVVTAHPRRAKMVLQLIPHWIRHMARDEPRVDLKKLGEAMRLMEEALR